MNKVMKIVITGGPCAGKTTILSTLTQVLTELGYVVLIGGESASEIQLSGFKPYGKVNVPNTIFQKELLQYQLYKENMYDRMIASFKEKAKCILLLDRGTMDNKAYCNKEEFSKMLEDLNLTEMDLLERYQMVIHMVTAAIGAEAFYTLENNAARSESLEEARALDSKTMACYLGHPNFHIVSNETNFEDKVKRVIQLLMKELKYPLPTEQQRKFIVSSSILEHLSTLPKSSQVRIEQFYTEEAIEHCFRKVFDGKVNHYYEIFKEDIEGTTLRMKSSTKISEQTYYQQFYNHHVTPIYKNRYAFIYQNQYFRLDVFDDGLCLLEIEATLENQNIVVPPFFQIIEEVTEDIRYRNRTLFQTKNTSKQKVFSKNV